MYRLLIFVSVCIGLQGCSSLPSDVRFSTPKAVSVRRVSDRDLSYVLAHLEIVAESPLPHLIPKGMNSYRVMGVTKQGNCVGGCPPSTIFVAIWNYTDFSDGRIQLYRIDGARFWKFIAIDEIRGNEKQGHFFSFRFQSRPAPGESEDYLAKIGFDYVAIQRL